MKRLFVAIELPDNIKDALLSLENDLKTQLHGRFVKRENLHITFLFLGNTTIPEEMIISAMNSSYLQPREIRISGIDAFPSINRPTVVFANVVTDLYEPYSMLCESLGLKREKTFSPHVTLCRINGKPESLEEVASLHKDSSLSFTADKLSLFDSDFKNYKKIF